MSRKNEALTAEELDAQLNPEKPSLIQIPTAGMRLTRDILKKRKKRGGDYIGRPGGKDFDGVRSIAKRLVEDPKYQAELLKRMQAGVAGNIEIWMWRYAYGDPQKNDEQVKKELERFERMREQVRDFLAKAPDRANVLDAAIQRAPRLLPIPTMYSEPIDVLAEVALGSDDS
jgi:hypothetical protein